MGISIQYLHCSPKGGKLAHLVIFQLFPHNNLIENALTDHSEILTSAQGLGARNPILFFDDRIKKNKGGWRDCLGWNYFYISCFLDVLCYFQKKKYLGMGVGGLLNKRPPGQIAPPFIIGFLATENLPKVKWNSSWSQFEQCSKSLF